MPSASPAPAAAERLAVFDGHNDVLQRVHAAAPTLPAWFFEGGEHAGQFDLAAARDGGFAGGIFALHVAAPAGARGQEPKRLLADGAWEIPAAPPLDASFARTETLAQLATALRLERAAPQRFELIRDLDSLRASLGAEPTAAVLHLEGAEAIDPDLRLLEVLYAAGLRSLGLTWSRPNLFGCGVPFRFKSSPDLGPGLTALGADLVAACNELGVLVDLAHLNLRGFLDVAELSPAPLVVSHACAHAVSPSSRNLLDLQLEAIRDSHGVIGLSFDCADLRPDGENTPNTGPEAIVRQLDYLAEKIGPQHLALGSDFDGAVIPDAVGSVAGLPRIFAALRDSGWRSEELELLASENWLRVIEATWRQRRSAPA